jgi:large subunit ribosomal protein L21
MTAATTKTKKAAAPKAKKSTKSEDNGTFAVFATGGKQYRVQVGDKVKIEKLLGDHKTGDKLTFDKVLLVDNGSTEATIGTPFIKGAGVKATLTKIDRHKKVTTIKYKQKSRYFKKYGHKQPYFEVTIDSIE